ncbi:MAG: hypothetical protein KDB80_00470, partial [Planctomycetes bacterium]|nr:hypothetical protein [Planctomycetota bacterium]
MNRILSTAAGLAAIVTISVGVARSYEAYRGTEHSRVPRPGKAHETASPTTARTPTPQDPKPANRTAAADGLELYPAIEKGMRTPFDLWRYYGRGRSSFASPVLPMRFEQWRTLHAEQKPKLMADVRAYMASRFDFDGKALGDATTSGGKPIIR